MINSDQITGYFPLGLIATHGSTGHVRRLTSPIKEKLKDTRYFDNKYVSYAGTQHVYVNVQQKTDYTDISKMLLCYYGIKHYEGNSSYACIFDITV